MEEKRNDSQIPEKKIEKVIKGGIKSRKKSRFAELFIKEDLDNVKTYVFSDVIIPAILDTIVNAGTNALNMIFYGEPRGRSSSKRSSHISYNRYYEDRDRDDRDYRRDRDRRRDNYDYEEIEFDNRGDAEEVLDRLFELINEYKIVSINDYYDLVGKHGNFTDEKYGWTDLRSARVERTYGGRYYIKLPRAVPLN